MSTTHLYTTAGNDDAPLALLPVEVARDLFSLATVTEDRSDQEHAALVRLAEWLDGVDGIDSCEGSPGPHLLAAQETRSSEGEQS